MKNGDRACYGEGESSTVEMRMSCVGAGAEIQNVSVMHKDNFKSEPSRFRPGLNNYDSIEKKKNPC